MFNPLPNIMSVFKESFSRTENMDTNNEIISKLKFIGRIQKGEKINVKFMYVQPDGLLTRIARTLFSQDNRSNAYTFIEHTLKRSFDIITLTKFSSKTTERKIILNIISDIEASLQGIANLKSTYLTDVMFCCKIDTLIQDTEAKLIEVKDSLGLSAETEDSDEVD